MSTSNRYPCSHQHVVFPDEVMRHRYRELAKYAAGSSELRGVEEEKSPHGGKTDGDLFLGVSDNNPGD